MTQTKPVIEHSKPGMARLKVGMEQTKLGMKYSKAGMKQTRPGMEHLKRPKACPREGGEAHKSRFLMELDKKWNNLGAL